MTGTITDVSREWATRPADQRFTSLAALRAFLAHRDELTVELTRPVTGLSIAPDGERMVTADQGGTLYVRSTDPATGAPGGRAMFSHWSFGQLAGIAGAPAGYLRRLPAPLAALCLTDNLARNGAGAFGDSGVSKMLIRGENGRPAQLAAFTSETYGRIRDLVVVDSVIEVLNAADKAGTWGIPGTFGGNSGRQYTPYNGTGQDTTLYAGDHDSFVFLADESRLIAQPGAGDYAGVTGGAGRPMSRGFIVSNSEVGSRTLRVQLFTFDYVCCNRIIWDASVVESLAIRHTSGAPRRFMAEALPAIRAFIEGSDAPMVARIERAQTTPVGDGKPETLTAWLRAMGLTGTVAQGTTELAALESGRTDTVWSAVQGLTAYARGIEYADERTELESFAGSLLADRSLASAGGFSRSTRGQRMATATAA
jgi:hypothetical protein